MRPWGSPNIPIPVADVSRPLESIADAIFAKIRHLRIGYVGVFHLNGAFYVFHEESNGFRVWFQTHRNTFVCSLSRMERPSQIAAKISKAYEKYREGSHDNALTHAESRENGEAEHQEPQQPSQSDLRPSGQASLPDAGQKPRAQRQGARKPNGKCRKVVAS